MGQQQSAEKGSSSSSKSNSLQPERDRKVNRRISIQALSHGRSTPVDPTASQETAVAQTTSQHLEKPALQQYLQNSSPEQYARAGKVERSGSRSSKEKKSEFEHRPRDTRQRLPVSVPQGSSGPMAVPASRSKQDTLEERFEEQHAAYNDRRYTPVAQTRPPRLPLPIADVAIPESPTLLPVDRSNTDIPIFETDDPLSAVETPLQRKSSMLSEVTTRSDEDVGDELQPFAVDPNSRTVPTIIEWNHGGHKVYVTGTFANWEKKYRLHPRYVTFPRFFVLGNTHTPSSFYFQNGKYILVERAVSLRFAH